MKRRIFNLLAALSLVMCVAMVVLWVRSYRLCHALAYVGPKTSQIFGVQSNFGELGVYAIYGLDISKNPAQGWIHEGYRSTPAQRLRSASTFSTFRGVSILGFGLGSFRPGAGPYFSCAFWLPHWFTAVVFAVIPTLRLRGVVRARRRRNGACAVCGYDLRATPERCPECGAESQRSDVRDQKSVADL